MRVRTRVASAVFIVALPAVVLVVTGSWRARREAAAEAIAATLIERMESGGRARCEADPAHFGLGLRGRGPRRHADRRISARGFAYDAALRPASPAAPTFPEEVAKLLEAEGVATLGDALAIRMPWSDGPCAVLLVHPRGRMERRAGSLARSLAEALGVLGVALAVSLLALSPPLKRLRRLSEEVRQIARQGYQGPTTVGGADEIGELARSFDEAARSVREHVERVESRERALTEYVDSTTHDLSIPLTVLQGQLSEAEQRSREGRPFDRALLEGALAECQYLAQLVGNMAAAAQLEGGEPQLQRAPLDLVALVERVAARFQPVARHGHVTLEYAVPDTPARVTGDDILIERAVGNLVHNAIRHRRTADESTLPGKVALVLEASGGRFCITVLDDGPFCDEALVERLTNGREEPGVTRSRGRGLGLRIVRAVAQAHGYTLTFRCGADGGLEVRLEGVLDSAPQAQSLTIA